MATTPVHFHVHAAPPGTMVAPLPDFVPAKTRLRHVGRDIHRVRQAPPRPPEDAVVCSAHHVVCSAHHPRMFEIKEIASGAAQSEKSRRPGELCKGCDRLPLLPTCRRCCLASSRHSSNSRKTRTVDVWFPSLPNGTRTRRACPPRRAGGHDQPSRSWLHSPCPTSRRLSGAGGRRKGVFARETSRCRFEDTTHDLTVAGLNVHAFAPWPLCERGASRRHPAHYPAADDRRSRLQGKLS